LTSVHSTCTAFFTPTLTTDVDTLSLHDALPICPEETACHRRRRDRVGAWLGVAAARQRGARRRVSRPHRTRSRRRNGPQLPAHPDRKSTRLNSSHVKISYAVFCLKKKKQ